MAGPTFDPNGAVRFDLKNGTAADAKGARVVLVPSAALDALDDGTLERLGGEVGRACGARLAGRLGGDAGVRSASLEAVVSHLAGELAVAGVGVVSLERWGRAMVAVVTNPSVANDAFLAAVLAGAIGAASGRDVAAAPLGRDRGAARYFIGASKTAEEVRELAGQGRAYAEIVASIQQAGAS
jgi:hypothetical protein